MGVAEASQTEVGLCPGYRLGSRLGQGSSGEVWSAEGPDGQPAALHFRPQQDGQQAAWAARSIQLVRGLQHLNLARIAKVWSAGGYLVTAMELADGSLADLLAVHQEAGSAIPALDLWPLLTQAAAVLDFLNSPQHTVEGRTVGIQHANIHPGNLLLLGPVLKLTGFSLAATVVGSSRPYHRSGKLAFAAPEVFRGQLSYRTDQYALAVSYCVLRGGSLPFADTPATVVPNYTRLAPDLSMLPAAARPVIARALAPVPQERWPCCQDLVAELRKATQSVASAHSSYGGPERRGEARYRADPAVRCRVLTGARVGEVRVRYVSAGGIGLELYGSGGSVTSGQTLSLGLANPRIGFERVVWLRVLHSSARKDGAQVLGGAFVLKLGTEDLEALREAGSEALIEA